MILAIAFLLIMATIMALMINMTSLTSKRSGDIYFQEQAHLIAKGEVEKALFTIANTDLAIANNCYNGTGAGGVIVNTDYKVVSVIQYIGNSFPVAAACNMAQDISGADIDSILTNESHGTVIIDIYVSVDNANVTSEPVRFHRRTMQKL